MYFKPHKVAISSSITIDNIEDATANEKRIILNRNRFMLNRLIIII